MHSIICEGWFAPKFVKLRAKRIGWAQVGQVTMRSMQIVSLLIAYPRRTAEISPVLRACAQFVTGKLKRDLVRFHQLQCS
jgi:hypothetical protein